MRNVLIFFLLWTCVWEWKIQAGEHHYYFERFSVQDGLSQSTVNAILQDNQGFLWFGTKDGLNRYDGLSFRQFNYDHSNIYSLGNNFVTALYEDKEKHIWVGTDVGLYIYYPERDVFERFLSATEEGIKIERSVSVIVGDEDGCVWVAVESQGIFCFDLRDETLIAMVCIIPRIIWLRFIPICRKRGRKSLLMP